jgi:hypothetical protein
MKTCLTTLPPLIIPIEFLYMIIIMEILKFINEYQLTYLVK